MHYFCFIRARFQFHSDKAVFGLEIFPSLKRGTVHSDVLETGSGKADRCACVGRNSERIFYRLGLDFPSAFNPSVHRVVMASGVFHLFRRVGFRLQEEMFEAGIIRVGLDSQRTIIHPRAYRTEGIVIEGVHPVVLSESIGMGV